MLKKTLRFILNVQPAPFFVVVALIFGGLMALITPPFQMPDEPSHLFRAYQISRGKLSANKIEDGYGGKVPIGMVEAKKATDRLVFRPDQKTTIGETKSISNLPIDSKHQIPQSFTNTAVYTPVVYLPQAAGILVTKALPGMPRFGPTLYAARLFNLLVGVALLYFAIRLIPFGRWALTTVLLLPMTLFGLGSASSDPITIGLVCLGLVFSLYCFFESYGGASRKLYKHLLFLGTITLFLALIRLPYALFAAIPLLTALWLCKKHAVASKVWLPVVGVGVISGILFLWWQLHIDPRNLQFNPYDPLIRPDDQLKNIFRPLFFIGVLLTTHISGFFDLVLKELVGVFGWTDTPLPLWTIIWGYGILVLSITTRSLNENKDPSPTRSMRLAAAVLWLVSVVIMDIILYLYWTPFNNNVVFGLQGRYYLPLMPLLIIACYGWITLPQKEWIKLHLFRLGFIIVAGVTALCTLVGRYYLL